MGRKPIDLNMIGLVEGKRYTISEICFILSQRYKDEPSPNKTLWLMRKNGRFTLVGERDMGYSRAKLYVYGGI